jgi:hypothetical protein
LYCSQEKSMPATRPGEYRIRRALGAFIYVAVGLAVFVPQAAAGDAPQWMHVLVGATLPAYDEKTDAVLLYSDTNVTVLSADKIRKHVRRAYKILRPEGRQRGTVEVYFNPSRKITSLHGWCIPAQGKDYEVKEKDATDYAAPFEGSELVDDVKYRVLRIPAPDPGNIVGYEYEVETAFLVAGYLGVPGNGSGTGESLFAATSSRLGIQSFVAFSCGGEARRGKWQCAAVGDPRRDRDQARAKHAAVGGNGRPNDRVIFPVRWNLAEK